MKKYLLIVVSLLVIFAGCSKTSSSQEITDIITSDFSDWFGTAPYAGEEGGDTLASSGTKDYKWVFWYREDTLNAPPEISVDVVGDSAYVTWTRNIDGIFHRFPTDTFPPLDSLQDIPKHLQDTITRYGVFMKDGDPNRHHGWRLKKLTGALIDSPNHTVSIDSVKITTNTDTVVITDPLAFLDTTNVLTLSCDDSVNVTVYVDPSKSVLVFLHSRSRRNERPHRWMFRLESPGVFTGWWKAPEMMGRHLAAVDVIEYNTIFSDDGTTYPYDSEAWIIPFRTK